MSEKFIRSDLQKMNVDEFSQLIGYDYHEFMKAGGTLYDALAIANGTKSLNDVIEGAEGDTPKPLSDEQLVAIRRRSSPALQAILITFGIISFVIVFSFVGIALNFPISLVFAIALLLPVGFIIWRSR